MGMPQATHGWTAEMVRALPEDGNRYEVVDGELLVTPAPRLLHQRAIFALLERLRDYVRDRRVGELLFSPADIEFDLHSLVQPDVFVAPFVEGRRPRASSARADRQIKRRKYLRQGVTEYWIVDLDARLVERWRPGDERPEIAAQTLAWQPDPAGPALAIDLPAYFAEILDE